MLSSWLQEAAIFLHLDVLTLVIGKTVWSSECYPITLNILFGYMLTPLNLPSSHPVSNVDSSILHIVSTEHEWPVKRSDASPNQSHLNKNNVPSAELQHKYYIKKYHKFLISYQFNRH